MPDTVAHNGATTEDAPRRPSPRDAIIEALFELSAEREWKDISIFDIATRARVSLADFRDAFPSKGCHSRGVLPQGSTALSWRKRRTI